MTSDRFFPQLVCFLLTFFSETYEQGSTVPPSKVINKMCHEITPASRLATRAICSVVDYLIETTFCRMYWQQQNLLTRMKCDRVLFFCFVFFTLCESGENALSRGKAALVTFCDWRLSGVLQLRDKCGSHSCRLVRKVLATARNLYKAMNSCAGCSDVALG